MNILIVEDEFITIKTLRRTLTGMGYFISGEAMNADEAIAILDEGTTDLAILDINIEGEKNGIWVAEQIRAHYHIPFIFLTAYADLSTVHDAMTVKPYGYLVKPFETLDIFTAIETSLINHAERIHESVHENNGLLSQDSIFIKTDHLHTRIKFDDIIYIKSDGNYLEIYTQKERFIVRGVLKEYEKKMPESQFFRSQKSYLVNLDFLVNVGPNFITVKDKEIPLSERSRVLLLKRL